MKLISHTPRIELILKPHQLLSLGQIRHRMAIECKQGVLWVTSSGDNDDHLLMAGQRFVPVNNRKVVIEAIKDACVDIEEQQVSTGTRFPSSNLFRAMRGKA